MLLGACGQKADNTADKTTDMTADTTAVMSVSVSGGMSDSLSAVRPVCPPTGLWAECSVFERLNRMGLAPIRDSAGTRTSRLGNPARVLKIGSRTDLELYIYPDAYIREREQARLDAGQYVVYPAPVPMKPVPTLITSANLIAILHSRNDHLRERVSDALTAGPPQSPSKKKP